MNRELVEERSLTTEGRDLVIIDRCEVSADLMGAITEPLSSFYTRPAEQVRTQPGREGSSMPSTMWGRWPWRTRCSPGSKDLQDPHPQREAGS